jgi:ribosomal-protein-alanine N-acetyltransferase
MAAGDLNAVMGIAAGLETAPHWGQAAYEASIDAEGLPRRAALVAESGGQVAGFAIASVIAPEAELETIAVAAGLQRSGVGRTLLAALFCELEARGVGEVTLEVRESNGAARAFYRAHGFAEFAQRTAYYADTGEAAVLMRAGIRGGAKRE